MKYLLVAAIMASSLAVSYAEVDQAKVLETAYELLARASSTSEVLTLNLTNFIIILVIAGLIIALGLLGPLFGLGTGTGRSLDETDGGSLVKESDLVGGMCFIMYTSGNPDKLSCMKRTACEDPKTAAKYLQAGKLWHQMHKIMKVVPFNDGYVSIMNAVEDAVDHSLEGGDCSIYNW